MTSFVVLFWIAIDIQEFNTPAILFEYPFVATLG